MNRRITLQASLMLFAMSVVSCRSEPTYIEGGIYSVPAEKGGYAVVKILKLDDGGVHLRMYSNVFRERPRAVDTAKLYMAGINHKPTEQLGMGHATISKASFRTWGAEFIQSETVRSEELDGYRMWKESGGGYF